MMDIKILKLAFERMHDELERHKQQISALEERIETLEKRPQPSAVAPVSNQVEDELIDTKQVLNYLGICYNTLQSIVRKGLLIPIRINQRRIRYSKKAIYAYIESQSN